MLDWVVDDGMVVLLTPRRRSARAIAATPPGAMVGDFRQGLGHLGFDLRGHQATESQPTTSVTFAATVYPAMLM